MRTWAGLAAAVATVRWVDVVIPPNDPLIAACSATLAAGMLILATFILGEPTLLEREAGSCEWVHHLPIFCP
jgi:hypothetical protein